MASLLLPIIYLAFISLGLPDALLGAAWPCPQLLLPGAKWLDLCRIGTRGWRGCDRLCAGRHDPARDCPH